MKATRTYHSFILVLSVLGYTSISAQSIPTLSDQFVPKFSLSVDALDILQGDLSLYWDRPISDQVSIEIGLSSRVNLRRNLNPWSYTSIGATTRLKWFMPLSSGSNTMMNGLYLAGGLGYAYKGISSDDGSRSAARYREIGLNLDVGYQWLIADRATVDVILRNTFSTERFYKGGLRPTTYSELSSHIRMGLRVGGVFGKRDR